MGPIGRQRACIGAGAGPRSRARVGLAPGWRQSASAAAKKQMGEQVSGAKYIPVQGLCVLRTLVSFPGGAGPVDYGGPLEAAGASMAAVVKPSAAAACSGRVGPAAF